jgi:hypothetical protein
MARLKPISFFISLLTGLLLIPGIQGCRKSVWPDCVQSAGKMETVIRYPGYFKAVKLYDNIDLHLIPSGSEELELEAGSNLLDKIETYVEEDSVLVIRNNSSCNWVRSYGKPIRVNLKYRELRSIEYRSIGNVTCADTLRQDSLRIDIREGAGNISLDVHTLKCEVNLHYGTADIEITGISNQGYYYQLGAGKIDCSGLKAEQVYLRNWGSNNMFVWATKYLSVEIRGLGDVYYLGSPTINSSLFGEGRLLKMP